MTGGNEGRGWQCFLSSSWQRVSDSFSDAQLPTSALSSPPVGYEGPANEERGKNAATENCERHLSIFKMDDIILK